MTLTVPINQQSKLRPISSINQINKCVSILKTKPKIKRTMWSRRAQEYDQKIRELRTGFKWGWEDNGED